MGKNIVVLLDGTSNQLEADRTNILRLYAVLAKDPAQTVYYHPGVGTLGADGSWLRLWRRMTEVWGLATGWGLDSDVKQAYRFIVENYDRSPGQDASEPDKICIFGFSRGAYAARVLAGFIRALGLIEPRNLNLLDYAYRAYKRIGEMGATGFEEMRIFEQTLRPERPAVHLLGLFDTVSSVIESGRFGPRLRSHAFTKTNTSVRHVRHAVSLDERRTMFTPQLWPSGNDFHASPYSRSGAVGQDVLEVWFNGVHGDVGGGYPETESSLAKNALQWMISETGALGVAYKPTAVATVVLGNPRRNGSRPYVAPSGNAPSHRSMSAAWAVLEFLPRRKSKLSRRPSVLGWTIPFFERRVVPEGANIHTSAVSRYPAPANLPKTFIAVP
jgi:uncharacterized protein (DUF2235 family)